MVLKAILIVMSGEFDAYRADGMLFSVWAGHCHTSLVIGAEPLCIILEHMVQKLDGEQRGKLSNSEKEFGYHHSGN